MISVLIILTFSSFSYVVARRGVKSLIDSPQAAISQGGHPSGARRLIPNGRREEPAEKSLVCHVLAVWIWVEPKSFLLPPVSMTSGTYTAVEEEEGKWFVLVSRRRFPGGASSGLCFPPADFLQKTQPIVLNRRKLFSLVYHIAAVNGKPLNWCFSFNVCCFCLSHLEIYITLWE